MNFQRNVTWCRFQRPLPLIHYYTKGQITLAAQTKLLMSRKIPQINYSFMNRVIIESRSYIPCLLHNFISMREFLSIIR